MKPLKTPKIYYHYTIALTGQDNTNWITARADFSGVDIVRMGIREVLKNCPKVPAELKKRLKGMIPTSKALSSVIEVIFLAFI